MGSPIPHYPLDMNTSLPILALALLLPAVGAGAQVLTNGTDLDVTRSWYQQPQGWTYEMSIRVPTGEVPSGGFPVCILLHGGGGNAGQTINEFSGLLDCHVLIAPQGYLGGWDICSEPSNAPDVSMVGELIERVQAFENVDPDRIRIVGFSNGSALANNVLIQNTNPGLDAVCAVVSQLSVSQYHDGAFHAPSGITDPNASFCGYDQPVQPIDGRRYLCIANVNDGTIPYLGGSSFVGVDFLPAQLGTFRIAQLMGFTGSQLPEPGAPLGAGVSLYSYLDGAVVHLRGFAGHGMNPVQREFLADFLGNCAAPPACPQDLTGDDEVGGQDLALVLATWQQSVEPGTGADLNDDGRINGQDLAELLAYWGPCSG